MSISDGISGSQAEAPVREAVQRYSPTGFIFLFGILSDGTLTGDTRQAPEADSSAPGVALRVDAAVRHRSSACRLTGQREHCRCGWNSLSGSLIQMAGMAWASAWRNASAKACVTGALLELKVCNYRLFRRPAGCDRLSG
ncbi:hypothetical protein SAE02_76330 [Skermanella aerolata]|uniref:Uncharacterized protein n=1 Tax=Skermanella aerolata TaxID=393310 RepID=A0A512E455_9PROT|nr:hypothetical protein SAE02_76330 [Skermanella aerolata]